MNQNFTFKLFFLLILTLFLSCSSSDDYTEIPVIIVPEPVDPEPVDPEEEHLQIDLTNVPFNNLSEYGFFKDQMKDHQPNKGVVPFDLNSHLFTDYASKKRFVWMPESSSASYQSDHEILDFPEGTILIKTFYYENTLPDLNQKIIETRLLIKKGDDWLFATYEWNDDQTEATLITEGNVKNISWIDKNNATQNIDYRIPSNIECIVCHKSMEIARPIGPKPQNLNKNYNYKEGSKNQLQKWIEVGYLQNNIPSNILTTVNWEDTSLDKELRVRSYLDINCAHCHTEGGHCSYRDVTFDFYKTVDPTQMGVCTPQSDIFNPAYSLIINPRNAARSAIIARLSSTQENIMMPMIGRTIVHTEAVKLIESYINELQTVCN